MFLMRQTIIVMSRHIEFDQKNEVFLHYQQLDAAFYKTHSTGDLMSRMAEDVSRVRMFTGPAIMYLINLITLISLSVYFMFRREAEQLPRRGEGGGELVVASVGPDNADFGWLRERLG